MKSGRSIATDESADGLTQTELPDLDLYCPAEVVRFTFMGLPLASHSDQYAGLNRLGELYAAAGSWR